MDPAAQAAAAAAAATAAGFPGLPANLLGGIAAPPGLLVDPATVAPEYREAAQKRRAQQLRELECSHKADVDKVMPRERTAYLLHCLEADAATK